eukprot:SAG31_NODE_954_length_10804_cov_3.240355_1_plen_131_part_10
MLVTALGHTIRFCRRCDEGDCCPSGRGCVRAMSRMHCPTVCSEWGMALVCRKNCKVTTPQLLASFGPIGDRVAPAGLIGGTASLGFRRTRTRARATVGVCLGASIVVTAVAIRLFPWHNHRGRGLDKDITF